MKIFLRTACLLAMFVAFSLTSKADNRTNLGNGVSLVQYGNTWIIEDNNRGMSISVEITQAGIDRRNNEMMYNVVCNGITKTVVKSALKWAIKSGIEAAAVSEGTSLVVSVTSAAINLIYDKACDYWKDKGGY